MKRLLTSFAIFFWLTALNLNLAAQTLAWPVLPIPTCSQSYKIVILGSSTSFGTGASPVDSSWANKFRLYIQRDNAQVTFTNLALGGLTTYQVNPTGYIPPANRPSPDVTRNITAALALQPDAIIINLPTNDAATDFTLLESQNNFNRIVAAADAQNVPVWVTTSQPRNSMSASQINSLIGLKDWIIQRFGNKAIDFWTSLANTDASINTTYSAGDGVHYNNLGHHLIFTRVLDEKIWDSICIRKNGSSNPIPIANAGNNISISLPVNTVTLTGTGTDANGTIVSYNWSKLSGPTSGTIVSPTQPITVLNNLATGTYLFRLIVTDNNGARGSDEVSITVINPVNQAPIVNAGNDITITLPINTVTLNGSATDADGTISAYTWTKVSGPAAGTIATPIQPSTSINGLTAGTYVFRLSVTDNLNATGIDNISIIVNNAVINTSDVMDPSDPDVIFTAGNQPAAPAWNNYNVVKWGHTARLNWNPYTYGFRSYIFQGMAYRLKFPKTYQHKVNDGKKYPLFIFFHGRGELGTIYDNEYQLYHGGQLHAQKVDDGTFDGFLFYAQSTSGNSEDYLGRINGLIDSLVKYNKVDIDRVIVSGLSAGGSAAWAILNNNIYNKKIASSIPLAAASTASIQYFPNYIHIPIWISNGGQDASPAPYTVNELITAYKNLGGKIDQAYFPTLGHGVWGSFWALPTYFPYLVKQHKANPLIYFQRSEFCPNVTVDAKLGVNSGFFAYEWQKDGATIPGAVSNTLQVNTYGTYRARFKRTSTADWSDWSPSPAVISQKQATVTPPIQTNGLMSTVLPTPDGSTTVSLTVPNTFSAYEWRRVSDNAIVSTTNNYTAAVGEYKVIVTEQNGCSSNFSPNFSVISSNGTNLPDPASNVSAAAISSTEVDLNWNDNPTPQNNETAFEIYRTTSPGGNYKLIAIKGSNILNHSDIDLIANTKYYYIIRAVNTNGASNISNEVNVTTKSDITLPTAPSNLRITGSSRSSISLQWDESSDDVGVFKYDVYINGVKTYATSNTYLTITGLTAFQNYALYVRARDMSGNLSPLSNQVSGIAALNGLYYKYYEGTWSTLPDFNTLTPVASGVSPTVSITPRLRNDNFGFLWEGYINIPVSGSYTFETNSDDGSKLYIGQYSHTATALVNNDGLHGGQYRSGTITLTQGSHPIAITFFEQGGGESMNVYWTSTVAGITTRTLIPASAFADVVPSVTSPAIPSQLTVSSTSYKAITLNWTDNSNDETGFEIVRASSSSGLFTPIGTTSANMTSFIDSMGLNANTKYWYKIRSISQTAQSAFVGNYEGRWLFNNNYTDATFYNRTLTASGTPTFNAADKKEGTHAISLTGSQAATMAFSSNRIFPSDAYDTRTVALWVKPTAATISGTNKIIFDLGGSDFGLAVRFNSGTLQAGIANNNVRSTISVASVASDINWINGGWNHIAIVYNKNILTLFVNGANKGSANVSFTSIGSTTGTSAIAVSNGSNAFNSSTGSTNYNGLIDDFIILEEPLNASGILSVMNNVYASGATQALPSTPEVPSITNLVAVSSNSISMSLIDNSTNEIGFEIYRSVSDNSNFRLHTTLPSNNTSSIDYTDNDLFANTNYYYKVRSVGIGGKSEFSTESVVNTLNNIPILKAISDFTMRFASQKSVLITGTDVDGDPLNITFTNPLPSFATFVSSGNGSGYIQLNPSIADIGTYNFSIKLADDKNGEVTESFNLVVNSNYVPVISAVSNFDINEGTTTSMDLTASDQDGNSTLSFSLVSSPSFASLIDNGNGAANITLRPGFTSAGSYPITFSVNDGNGASEFLSFNVTVANALPTSQIVKMRMQYTSPNTPSPWNNINSVTTSNLKDENGLTTPVGIQFLSDSWNGGEFGVNTGNNSGVYPDAVMKDYFWFGTFGKPETMTFNLNGLDVSKKYNITLFGSSMWRGMGNNGTTIYNINGVSKSLYVDNNYLNTVSYTNVIPNSSGIISVNMSKAADGTPYGLITAVTLEQQFDDGTAPIIPTSLTSTVLSDGTVRLNWKDEAYNEERYLVYRGSNAGGPFALLNPGASNANSQIYIDNTVSSSTTYYYKIEATNSSGTSGETGLVSALTTNKTPVLTKINDINIKSGLSAIINIAATDDVADILTTTVTGLPSFAIFQNTGNGSGIITVSPGSNETGIYNNVVVSVRDNFGVTVSDTFSIAIADPDIRSVFINYGPPAGEGGINQSVPWNNILSFPYANAVTNNLIDDANINTGFGIRLLEQWSGTFLLGMGTGYNSGIYPDNVMRGSIYSNSSATRNIELSGLDPSKRYNIAVLSSHNAGQTSLFTLSSGVQSVSSEARYNDSKSVQLNGLVPSPSGTITVAMTKNASAAYLHLNALIIEEFTITTALLSPANLIASTLLDTAKISLKWSDRSTDETGFAIWRSTNPNGSFNQIATTSANSTGYTDLTVRPNIRYFYKVQALNGITGSRFSNVSTEILSTRIVYINLNLTPATNGPTPWNNTTSNGILDNRYSDLKDNTLANSGIEMLITGEFSGIGYAGVTTAGIFPGVVMSSNYWTDAGVTSGVQFNNLNIRKKYRIGFFGSAISSGYFMATYTCNGHTVELNNLYNDSKIVYLTNLIPNQDGELKIEIKNADGSPYCFTSAITIESYDDDAVYSLPINGQSVRNNNLIVDMTSSNTLSQSLDGEFKVKVYPNPFSQNFTVDLSNDNSKTVTLLLFDMSNRLVYKETIVGGAGHKLININLNGKVQLKGTYILQIMSDGKFRKPIKLLKLQ